MRILMLSWEYPPCSVGGLAQHVADLTTALARAGEEVHLITCAAPESPEQETSNGVSVYRVNPYNLPALDFITGILQLNLSMLEHAVPVLNDCGGFDLIHAHDWLVAFAGRMIKHAYKLPLIATIHATEYGRNQGLHNNLQRYISDVEWWLAYEAWRVIVCSRYMKNEVQRVFQLPDDKLRIISNGVDLGRYQIKKTRHLSRSHYAAPEEKIVLFVGRLVQEKGAQILIEAIPKVLHYYAGTKFIIAGKGPAADYLKNKARDMGIYERIFFTGYIDDTTRDFLYQEADVAVFPSLYEPFGMVALEAMAARTPIVVADVGGLSEIVKHEVNGLKCYPGNSSSLADNILRLLYEPDFAKRTADQAHRDLHRLYTWREIARQTRRVYAEVKDDYEGSSWRTDSRLAGRGRLRRMRQRITATGRYAVPGFLVSEEHKGGAEKRETGGRYH